LSLSPNNKNISLTKQNELKFEVFFSFPLLTLEEFCKMKIQALCMMRWNADTPEAVILDAAYNLAEYNFFQKGRFVFMI
jgi:hypothetical protein